MRAFVREPARDHFAQHAPPTRTAAALAVDDPRLRHALGGTVAQEALGCGDRVAHAEPVQVEYRNAARGAAHEAREQAIEPEHARPADHSQRSASIGSRREALRAGYHPKKTPTPP